MEIQNNAKVSVLTKFKNILKRTPVLRLYESAVYWRWVANDRALFKKWLSNGKQGASPHRVKVSAVKEYANRFGLKYLVETGTYLGYMVIATKKIFDHIYSIELSSILCRQAQERFRHCSNVSILEGDSGEILPQVLEKIHKPCLFWLDGHYSGGVTAKGLQDTPIERELMHIFTHPLALNHVILIDDARCFDGKNGYPTISKIKSIAASRGFENCEVLHDIIRIYS